MSKYIGEIFTFGGTSTPAACIEAGGQAISRTVYAALFAEYGTTYGAGNGTTTFNVPDMRGRVAAGPNTMGGSAALRLAFATGAGATGGDEQVALVSTQVPRLTTIGGDLTDGQASFGNGEYEGEPDPHPNVQPTLILRFLIYTGVSE